jgi:tRNA A-37 threonylcarbamoyl transferase component Bud32
VRTFGKYRLLEQIGSGGMAEVWRAELPGPAGFVKDVALKLIRAESEGRSEWVRMFAQEARVASRLTHANVVQVFDFGEFEGRHYIAMELVRGRTLREVLRRCREMGLRLGVERAVHVCAEVARGLAYAHRYEEGRPMGIVHRDVSPQNVLLSFEGEVKLADFGIARALGVAEATAPGTVKGKGAYMAPEQARGEPVDGRVDIFALGVILWELCAGRRLFARDSDAATLAALLSAAPPSAPSTWNEAVQPDLDALVLAALERDPARRTGSAEELVAGLAAIRLRMAAANEDDLHLDLRAFMRRLWPEGEVPVPGGRAAGEGTVRRTLVREPGRARRMGGVGEGDEVVALAGRKADEGAVRRTLVREPDHPAVEDDADAGSLADTATPSTVTLEAKAKANAVERRRHAARSPAVRRLLAVACGLGAGAIVLLGARAVQKTAARTEAHGRAAPSPEQAVASPDAGARTPSAPAAAARAQPLPVVNSPERAADERAPPEERVLEDVAASETMAGERRPREGRVLEVTSMVGSLRVPYAETGQGIIDVTAEPFGTVLVDGKAYGETPLALRVAAGVYRVEVAHKGLGKREVSIHVQPGKRSTWTAEFTRRRNQRD